MEEDDKKIYFFLKNINDVNSNITSKSQVFIKINGEYFHWTTSNHIIEKSTLNFNLFLILFFLTLGGFIFKFYALCTSCFRFKDQ